MAMTPRTMDDVGEDEELDHLGDDDAEHAALDHVERGDRHQDEGVLVGAESCQGRNSVANLPMPLKRVGQEADDAHQGEDHDDEVGELGALALAEPRLDPGRARSWRSSGAASADRYTIRKIWLKTGHTQGIQTLFSP